MTKFTLRNNKEDLTFCPTRRQFLFYQICGFPVDKKYNVRKITLNENGEITKTKEKQVTKSELKQFLKFCPKSKYSIYPTYNMSFVGLPEANEILTAMSVILNS